jgi:hypothetical protein
MMQPSLSLLFSALAAKTGVRGKKRPLLLMHPPTIKEFYRCRPGCNVYVGRAVRDWPTNAQG